MMENRKKKKKRRPSKHPEQLSNCLTTTNSTLALCTLWNVMIQSSSGHCNDSMHFPMESHDLLQKQERIIGLHLKCTAHMHEYKHSHKYETFFSEKFILK